MDMPYVNNIPMWILSKSKILGNTDELSFHMLP